MNVVLWILQTILAVMFLWHGWLFLSPPAELAETLNAEFPVWFRLFVGAAEVLAAIGLVLPGVTRILPKLTPLAAAGLMIVTISATAFHLSRGEAGVAATAFVLFVLAACVAYGRWRARPIAPRPGHVLR